jgi:hypothetical protein
MRIKIIETQITKEELKKIAEEGFGDLVKAVVDIDKGIMAVGGELHADEEAALLESGSLQENLWGINLYPDKPNEDFIEFDSIINLRPAHRNRSRGVEDPSIQAKIKAIIKKLVKI